MGNSNDKYISTTEDLAEQGIRNGFTLNQVLKKAGKHSAEDLLRLDFKPVKFI
jgi:hypothetical protein